MGRGMLRWAAFLRKLKPGGTFFQTWVVGRCNAGQARMQRCTNCRQAAMSRHQRRQACGGKVTRGPVWLSLSPSVAPGLPRSQPRCHGSSSHCPRGRALVRSHSRHRRFPVKVTLWHLMDRTGREGKGQLGACVSPSPLDPVTSGAPVWPCPSTVAGDQRCHLPRPKNLSFSVE